MEHTPTGLLAQLKVISKKDSSYCILLLLLILPFQFIVGYGLIDEVMLKHMSYGGNDPESVVALLASYGDFYFKTGRHPLIMIYNPLGLLLNQVTGSPGLSALILINLASGITLLLFYALLRRFDLSSFRAFLFTALLGSSVPHIFAGAIPETFIFTAMSILLLMVIHTYTDHERTFHIRFIPAAVLAFGMAVTSIAPIAMILLVRYWKRGLLYLMKVGAVHFILVFVITTILAYIQTRIYGSNFFLSGEGHFTHLIADFFDLKIIQEPFAALQEYMPPLVWNHTVAKHSCEISVLYFEGYYHGDHLFVWPLGDLQTYPIKVCASIAYLALMFISLWGWLSSRSTQKGLSVILILYVCFTLVFHMVFNPMEAHIFAVLYAFPQIALVAVGTHLFQLPGTWSAKLPAYTLNIVLVTLVGLVIANGLTAFLRVVNAINTFPWEF